MSKWLRDELDPEYKEHLQKGHITRVGNDKWDERFYFNSLMTKHLIEETKDLKCVKTQWNYRFRLPNETISGLVFKNVKSFTIEIGCQVHTSLVTLSKDVTMKFSKPVNLGYTTPFFDKFIDIKPDDESFAPTVTMLLARDCPNESLFTPEMDKGTNVGCPKNFDECLPPYTIEINTLEK